MYNAEQNNEFIRQLNADEWTRVFNFFKGQFMIDISARDHSTSNNGRPFLPANCCACYYRSGDLGDCRKIYLNRD